MTEMTEEFHRSTAKRGLSTARAVLQVLAFLSEHPQGVHADEVAKVVGKSASTAYYLLASLCEEGFAVHEGGVYLPVHRFDETARQRSRRRATPRAWPTPSTACSYGPTSAPTSGCSSAARSRSR